MKSITFYSIILIFLIGVSILNQGCKPDDVVDDSNNNGNCDTCIMVLKPNIYIYTTNKTALTVNLSFPKGGRVVTSIPEYGDGWRVSVDKNGLINNKYGYLFYESSQPDVWQLDEGWIVKQEDLKDFFAKNMASYGFAGREIEDFTDYWIPRFTDAAYYEIYPQTQERIESVIELHISKVPDYLLRLFYVVRETNTPANDFLKEPQINNSFKSEGFYLTEWGVILK